MKQRIDCSDTVNFLNEFNRLCNASSCEKCYFGSHAEINNPKANTKTDCLWRIANNSEEVVYIVQKWSDNNQPDIPTYLEYFKENFPFDKFTTDNSLTRRCLSEYADIVESFCFNRCVGAFFDTGTDVMCADDCSECWNQPIPEKLLKELNRNENTDNTNKQ